MKFNCHTDLDCLGIAPSPLSANNALVTHSQLSDADAKISLIFQNVLYCFLILLYFWSRQNAFFKSVLYVFYWQCFVASSARYSFQGFSIKDDAGDGAKHMEKISKKLEEGLKYF